MKLIIAIKKQFLTSLLNKYMYLDSFGQKVSGGSMSSADVKHLAEECQSDELKNPKTPLRSHLFQRLELKKRKKKKRNTMDPLPRCRLTSQGVSYLYADTRRGRAGWPWV